MYIEAVPNRDSPPAILLRESYREAGKVKKRTLLNLSDWPQERIAGFKALLKGGTVIPKDQDAITIIRSLPHGHVDAALGTARKIGLDRLLGPDGNRCRDLILALVVSRILDPSSKLGAARALSPDTATSSLGEQLALGVVDEDELYSALDWLAVRQPAIEATLAKRHFTGGTLVLYDVSSSYLEGRCCPLAQFGYRGMITQARICEDIKSAGLDWITALRAPAIKALLDGGALQMSLFDDRDMAGITSPEFPGERLIVCRNRALASERARKREDLLAATERDLARIAAAVARKRQPLRGKAEIGLEIGAVLDKHKMAKHFALAITDTRFSFARKTDEITVEAALDGLYVVRTSLPAAALDDTATVRSYKSLSLVERAFRCIKTVDLQIRPVYHWLADRVRAHVFVCMLAYYLEWHMRQRLAPLLYDDTDKEAAEAQRSSVVAKAERSPAAVTKQTTGRTDDGLPVHSFRTLLNDLATLTRNTLVTAIVPEQPFTLTARPTPVQQRARDLLGLSRTQ